MSSYLGDFRADSTFDCKFTTVNTSGVPTTLGGSPVVSAFISNTTTPITAGITLTVDFNSVTGLHNIRVVATTANGYTSGSNFQLVITTGTVGGTSVVGYVVHEFSVQNRVAQVPTGGITRNSFAADTGLQSIRSGTAQSGSTGTTLKLDAIASVTDDFYNNTIALLTSGTGTGQFGTITDYVGSTKVATMASAWLTTPDATTTFALFPAASVDVPTVDDTWDELIGDGTLTAREALRIAIAALAGELSGAATSTVTIRNIADSANVIVASVDTDGNRLATTVTP